MAPSLHDTLERAAGYLPAAFDEPFSGHPLAALLVKEAPDALRGVIDDPGYKFQGSPGRGRWAETVWVPVFDRLVTTSAQRGYYIVYLLRRDGEGIYLSLNQGTTAVHQEVGGRRYLSVLEDQATFYAGLLSVHGLEGLQRGPIELGGSGTLTRGYQAGNIVARYYKATALPDDAELDEDLRRLAALYRRLVEANDYLADADTPTDPDEDADGGDPSIEGKRLRWHLRAERNAKLIRDAKRIHGSVCAVCSFSYKDRYGELGAGYIEAHHLTPFAELEGRPTQLDPRIDFAVVCASYHRMIHRRQPPYSLDDVKAALRWHGATGRAQPSR